MINTPLREEIPYLDPVGLFSVLPKQGALFLDSAMPTEQGRYSFIAIDPFAMKVQHQGKNPFPDLQALCHRFILDSVPELPPFQGGIAGCFGYELGTYFENYPRAKQDDLAFPELMVGLYDVVIGWDHLLKKAWVFSSGFPEITPKLRQIRAQKRRDWVMDFVKNPISPGKKELTPFFSGQIASPFTQATYEAHVNKVIDYIRAGDIFEANLSQRFSTHLKGNPNYFELYRQLRQKNPAPFSAYFEYGPYVIASASPERFLQLQKGKVESRPIKGTRPRHANPLEDSQLAQDLKQSEKDRAENVMIVDLMRNDLSRVCLPHSVKVPQLCKVETFATVHHLISVVEGKLNPEKTAIDLLKACFPGGSITGAPKIRAMEIIAQLEPTVRGPYCGSMGYIGFNGEMDLSITIRSYAIRDKFVTFQTGGAITVDSHPTQEYEETLTKARALREVLERF